MIENMRNNISPHQARWDLCISLTVSASQARVAVLDDLFASSNEPRVAVCLSSHMTKVHCTKWMCTLFNYINVLSGVGWGWVGGQNSELCLISVCVWLEMRCEMTLHCQVNVRKIITNRNKYSRTYFFLKRSHSTIYTTDSIPQSPHCFDLEYAWISPTRMLFRH